MANTSGTAVFTFKSNGWAELPADPAVHTQADLLVPWRTDGDVFIIEPPVSTRSSGSPTWVGWYRSDLKMSIRFSTGKEYVVYEMYKGCWFANGQAGIDQFGGVGETGPLFFDGLNAWLRSRPGGGLRFKVDKADTSFQIWFGTLNKVPHYNTYPNGYLSIQNYGPLAIDGGNSFRIPITPGYRVGKIRLGDWWSCNRPSGTARIRKSGAWADALSSDAGKSVSQFDRQTKRASGLWVRQNKIGRDAG